jgi:hypothetical protein
MSQSFGSKKQSLTGKLFLIFKVNLAEDSLKAVFQGRGLKLTQPHQGKFILVPGVKTLFEGTEFFQPQEKYEG